MWRRNGVNAKILRNSSSRRIELRQHIDLTPRGYCKNYFGLYILSIGSGRIRLLVLLYCKRLKEEHIHITTYIICFTAMRNLSIHTLLYVLSLVHQTHSFSGLINTRYNVCSTNTCSRRGNKLMVLSSSTSDNNNNNNDKDESPIQTLTNTITSDPQRTIYFSFLMTLCGAVLGPFLDSYHSLFGVLTYETPLVFPVIGTDLLTCVTTYWVPPLFGLAGFIIGWLYICLDAILIEKEEDTAITQLHPSIPKVLVGISYFTFQYWLSGILFAHGVDRTSILVLMSTLAGGGFVLLDGTTSGFITSAATAIGGPLIEVGLISYLSGSWSYHYNDLGETGLFFPLWIIPVYFLGGVSCCLCNII